MNRTDHGPRHNKVELGHAPVVTRRSESAVTSRASAWRVRCGGGWVGGGGDQARRRWTWIEWKTSRARRTLRALTEENHMWCDGRGVKHQLRSDRPRSKPCGSRTGGCESPCGVRRCGTVQNICAVVWWWWWVDVFRLYEHVLCFPPTSASAEFG